MTTAPSTLLKIALRPTLLSILVFMGAGAIHAAPTDNIYSAGHADIGVAYEDGELHLHNHFGVDTVINGAQLGGTGNGESYEYDLNDVTTYVSLSSANNLGSTPYNSRLGIPGSGGTVYVLPATQNPDLPFLGFATEDLEAGDWTTPLTFTLLSVSGLGNSAAPGEFSLWNNGTFGQLNFYFSTNDPAATANGNNTLALPTGTHAHYNWGFTSPGVYEVEVMVSGVHATDGYVSDTQTITFGVGVVPEPSTYALITISALAALVFYRKRQRVC